MQSEMEDAIKALAGAEPVTFAVRIAHSDERVVRAAVEAAKSEFGSKITLSRIYAPRPTRRDGSRRRPLYRSYGTMTLQHLPTQGENDGTV